MLLTSRAFSSYSPAGREERSAGRVLDLHCVDFVQVLAGSSSVILICLSFLNPFLSLLSVLCFLCFIEALCCAVFVCFQFCLFWFLSLTFSFSGSSIFSWILYQWICLLCDVAVLNRVCFLPLFPSPCVDFLSSWC